MIYTHKELLNKYKSNYQINKAVKKGQLYKINDLYSDKKNIHYLEILTKKYPNSIVTFDTAYYYHNLTDVIPRKICVATERITARIKDSRIKQSFVIEKYYNLGETTIEYEGVMIKIYDKADGRILPEDMTKELASVRSKNTQSVEHFQIVDEIKSKQIKMKELEQEINSLEEKNKGQSR